MATFVKGDIVVLPFPFSDLSDAKRRPTLVVATLPLNDLMLCMITSQSSNDSYSTAILDGDFVVGGLNKLLVIQTTLVQSPQKPCCKGFTETNMQFRCLTA